MNLYRVSIMALFVFAFGLFAADSTFAQRATAPSNKKSTKREEAARERREEERNEKFRKSMTPAKIKAQQEGKTAVLPLINHDVSLTMAEMMRLEKPLKPENGRRFESNVEETFEFPGDAPISLGGLVESFLQREVLMPTALVAGANFEGPGAGIPGFSVTGAPPDTTMAVGPNHVVAWVNTKYMIFNKVGVAQLPAPGFANGNVIWTGFAGVCGTTNRGDPLVSYDRVADRWVFSQFAFNVSGSSPVMPYRQCFAISTGPDPAGPYNRYEYSFDTVTTAGGPAFNDYGKIGVWNDGYYVGYNMFGGSPAGSNIGAGLCVYERDAMLAGTAADGLCAPVTFYANGASIFPADNDGPTPPTDTTRGGWFVRRNTTPGSLRVLRLLPNYAANTVTVSDGFSGTPSSFFELTSAGTHACNGTGGTCIPQLGTTNLLDTLGSRLMYRVAYRNRGGVDSIVITHSVDPDGAGTQNAAIRWYEIRNPLGNPADPVVANRPFLFQNSTFSPDTTDRWMGAAAMNGDGDIFLGYSRSSATINPGIGVAARQAGDPLNTLQSEIVAQAGSGSQSTGLTRWGDYTTASVDPADDRTFWFIGQYLSANGTFNWRTRIVSYTFPTGPTPTPTNTPTATPTNTPTATPTNTPTATPTNTPTATPTNTPTATPTATPTLPTVQLSSPAYSVAEASLVLVVTVNRSGNTAGTSTVVFSTGAQSASSGASCTPGVDFVTAVGSLTFSTGVTSQTFNVPICNDGLAEPSETFSVGLSAPTGATLGTPDTSIVTITDSGGTPTPTATPTNTPTATPTNTPTATPTATPVGGGLESDVAPRPSGDGSMTSTDVVQIRRFAASLDTINPAVNELQRADSAPRSTFGNNVIDSADVVQARRYAANLDPPTTAGGPAVPPPGEELAAVIGGGFMSGDAKGRSLRLRSSTATAGGDASIGVSLDQRGTDVAGVMFTLVYDPSKLSSPNVRLSPNAPAGVVLTVNDSQPGRLTILVDSTDPIRLSDLLSVTFKVADDASGTIPVAIDGRSLSVASPLGETIVMSAVETNVQIRARSKR